ncbi:hypothetical protein FGIG_04406 [Fasciola gigantica]|uniref:Uncharacterized protein n=1 Tax=Fasciola gigantica TaxID=46835 RepID=A0A504YYN8_FASGI|nr:hypothetical protein FGIG_04406 [Fasciola gigantica]
MKPSNQSGLESQITDVPSTERRHHSGGAVIIGPSPSSRRCKDSTDHVQRSALKSTTNRAEGTGKIGSSQATTTDQRGLGTRGRSNYSSRSRSRSGRTTDTAAGTTTRHPNAAGSADYSPRSKMPDMGQKPMFHGTIAGHQSQPLSSQSAALCTKSYGPSPTESVSTVSDGREQERRQISSEDYIGEYHHTLIREYLNWVPYCEN